VKALDRGSQEEQFRALTGGDAFSATAGGNAISSLSPSQTTAWLAWASSRGLIQSTAESKVANGFVPSAVSC
jgi:hypothetical protein